MHGKLTVTTWNFPQIRFSAAGITTLGSQKLPSEKALAGIEITEYLEVWKSDCICGNIFILVCCIRGMADDSAQLYLLYLYLRGKKKKEKKKTHYTYLQKFI